MMLAAIRHNHFSTWGMYESIPHHQELGTALQRSHHSDWYIPLGLRLPGSGEQEDRWFWIFRHSVGG